MAKTYICKKYPELCFYASGKRHNFSGGVFVTSDQIVQDILDKIKDVVVKPELIKEVAPVLPITNSEVNATVAPVTPSNKPIVNSASALLEKELDKKGRK